MLSDTSVYYYVPDNERPSWGAGMIYYHVWLLNKNGIPAAIVHDTAPFKLKWLELDVPIVYFDAGFLPASNDTLVVAEFYANRPVFKKCNCRKIAFVQNAFYIFDGLALGDTYESLGYDQVFYYMPHLKKVLSRITTLPLYEIPPFIAPYYFGGQSSIRKKRILVYPKFDSRDYNILIQMLKRELNIKPHSKLKQMFTPSSDWQIREIKDMSHREVAENMKHAQFFISLNTTEAFNSAVPEAMASGCINLCYEAVGPADFLCDTENAYVFRNNHVYDLTNKLVQLVGEYDQHLNEIETIRTSAYRTAQSYTVELAERQLVAFFK